MPPCNDCVDPSECANICRIFALQQCEASGQMDSRQRELHQADGQLPESSASAKHPGYDGKHCPRCAGASTRPASDAEITQRWNELCSQESWRSWSSKMRVMLQEFGSRERVDASHGGGR